MIAKQTQEKSPTVDLLETILDIQKDTLETTGKTIEYMQIINELVKSILEDLAILKNRKTYHSHWWL